LDLEVYEVKRMPVLDSSCLSPSEVAKIEAAFAESANASEGEEPEARRKLDEAIYDALGLNQEQSDQVEEGLKELQELRRLRTQA
jgi:hypothetical protein